MDNNTQQLSRKERERLYKRQEIVAAAREVFALRGYSAATLDEIAEKAEFGKGTLYSYFQGKDELFDTVIADVFDELVDIAVQTCSVSGKGIEESYRDFARTLLCRLYEHYGIYFLMMREINNLHQRTHFATLFPDLLLILGEPLMRGLPSAALQKFPPEQLGVMFLTMLLSVFRSSMHMMGLQRCEPGDTPVMLSKEEINGYVNRSINMLEHIFFHGVLSLTDENNLK